MTKPVLSTVPQATPVREAAFRLILTGGAPKLTAVTDSVQPLLGYRAGDFLSGQRVLSSLIHPDDGDIAAALFSPAGPAGEGVCNLRLRHANGRILCVKGVHRRQVTTDGVVLELQLQDAKSLPRTMADAATLPLFATMMENTDDYIYFKDRNHVCTGASQTLVSLCAPASHWTDLIGQTDYDIFPEAYADIYYKLEKQIFAGVSVAHEVQKILGKDGKEGWVDNRKYPIRDTSGAIIGLYGIARDISELKQAEADLRQYVEAMRRSEHDLKSSQHIAHLGSWHLDVATNQVTWTEELYRMYGADPALPPPPYTEHEKLFTPASWARLSSSLAHTKETGVPYELELETVRTDGGHGWMWVRGEATRNAAGKITNLWGVAQDITERKQAEHERNLHSEIMRNVPEGIHLTRMADLRIVFANDRFEKMLGYAPGELIGKDIAIVNAPGEKDPEETKQAIAAALKETGEWHGEIENIRKDGTRFWCEAHVSAFDHSQYGRVFLAIHTDISARKQTTVYASMARDILHQLNEPEELAPVIQRVIGILKAGTGVDALGIRLQVGEDYPYFAQEGFTADFLRTENTLVAKAAEGGICRNPDGSAALECTCGLVIAGKADATNKLFTPGGSCWTNDSLPLLHIPTSEDPRLHPRNVCVHRGYASIALIPIRAGKNIVGLIQLNDRRKGYFNLGAVELMEGIANHIGAALLRRQAEEVLRRDHASAERMRRTLLSAAEDKMKAQAALHETNSRLLGVMENLTEGLVVGDEQGQTVYWNPAALAMHGYTSMDDCRRQLDEFARIFELRLPNEDRPLPLTDWPMSRALRGEQLQNLVVRIRRVDQGWEKIITYTGWLIQRPGAKKIVFLSITDITDRTQAEEKTRQTMAALEEAREVLLRVVAEQKKSADELRKLTAVIEQAPLSVVITNLRGEIEYVNPRFCHVTGYTAAEAIGQNPRILKSGETPAAVYREMWETLNRGEVWSGELSNLTKAGDVYLENAIIAPVVDASGRATHYVALKDDITAKKRHEADLLAKLQREHELSEMKTRFISVTSHEFRTPMAAAMGSVEILANHFDRLAPEKRQALLARIGSSMHRMTEMLDEVLLVNRMDANRVEVRLAPLDLRAFVHHTIEEIRLGDRDEHQFDLQVAGDARDFPSDTNLLHHILSNLLSNAVRFSPAQTLITVRLSASDTEAQVAVEDHGIGIPEADHARIFEPFERGSNVGNIKGTGLGLNIVQRMTTMLGGSIALAAVEGGGSRFTVTLPRLPQPAPPPAKP